MNRIVIALAVISFCVLAAFQVTFGRHEFFPNFPLIFAFFCGASRRNRTVLPVIACGFVMDVLSWGWIGPHTLSLTAVFFAAMKISRVFNLLRSVLLPASVFICSQAALIVILLSHGALSENILEVSPQTALVQACSNTVAAQALFHAARFFPGKNERA